MDEIISYVKKEYDILKIDASHDFVHAYNVYNNTSTILEHDFPNENNSFYITAKCCALTHDLCDKKYVKCKTQAGSKIKEVIKNI